jgi:hypothetical protein
MISLRTKGWTRGCSRIGRQCSSRRGSHGRAHFSSHLVSSRLVSSRLVSSRLVSSLLFSSLLVSSLLFSSLLVTALVTASLPQFPVFVLVLPLLRLTFPCDGQSALCRTQNRKMTLPATTYGADIDRSSKFDQLLDQCFDLVIRDYVEPWYVFLFLCSSSSWYFRSSFLGISHFVRYVDHVICLHVQSLTHHCSVCAQVLQAV